MLEVKWNSTSIKAYGGLAIIAVVALTMVVALAVLMVLILYSGVR